MEARLQLFRAHFERLDPASTARAVEDGLYVDPPGRALGAQIATRLQLAPASSHLVLGCIGTGKTTEIRRAARLLRESTDTTAAYVEVSRHHDLDKKLKGVLIVLAGLELSKAVKHSTDDAVKAVRKRFFEWAHGYSEFVPYDENDYGYDEPPEYDEPGRYLRRPGVLAAPLPSITDLKERIDGLRTLLAALPPPKSHFAVCFDSLDRLDADAFHAAVVEDIRGLHAAGVGVCVVGPSPILYGKNRPTADLFDQLHTLPALAVDRNTEGYEFFLRILKKRVDDSVVGSTARQELVEKSGGLIRDLLELTRSSVEEAFVAESDSVRRPHVAKAVDMFGRTLMLGLRKTEVETLQKLRRKHVFVPTEDEDMALLVSRRVLEYQGVTKTYSVHPTLLPLLEAMDVKK